MDRQDFRGLLARADEARRVAVLRAELPADEREASAREFASIAAQVALDPPDVPTLEAALDEEPLATTAARLAAASEDRELCRAVLAAAVHLDQATWRLLAQAVAPIELLRSAEQLAPRTALDVRKAVAFTNPDHPEGRAALATLLSGDRSAWAAGMSVLLRQRDVADLQDQLATPPPADDPPVTLAADRPTTAAFYLGVLGQPEGVTWLAGRADQPGPGGAAAVVRLAWLGRPEGVAMLLEHVRRGADEWQAGLLLDSAATLACAALVPVLAGSAFDSVRPDADAVARAISGGRPALDPQLRYRAGDPLTLAHLADDLRSPHEGPRASAAFGLRAATGEDHGFDLELDLPANLPAIVRWREHAARARVPLPGQWAWQGHSLPVDGPR